MTSFVADSMVGSCKYISWPSWPRRPLWMPNVENEVLTGQRVSHATSIFGDLGGSWHMVMTGSGSCDVDFHESVMDLTCTALGGDVASIHVDVAPSLISGYTSDGSEFSASRR